MQFCIIENREYVVLLKLNVNNNRSNISWLKEVLVYPYLPKGWFTETNISRNTVRVFEPKADKVKLGKLNEGYPKCWDRQKLMNINVGFIL